MYDKPSRMLKEHTKLRSLLSEDISGESIVNTRYKLSDSGSSDIESAWDEDKVII